ncbi:hypothetical protein KPL71_023980 [Citrus sinensis]|uniref:Uncharacterized protein n=2 Tax=Citrus sinensis TaxID=2711 RepID=A0ACB8IMX0_CITSI|nr:hypothetical protein KPL71_023980 [Citrus sinensis]
MASSSSSPRNSNKYEVFLSFKGEDTRDNFTSHLYSALCQNKIETFIDNDLKRGDEISQSLLDTIEASTISIVIFSERYASSGWCLDELLKILECKHGYGQIVIPVFYRVDPSHVRRQTGNFGDFFSKLEERFPQKLQRWRNALTEAANLSGFDSHVIRPESKLIKEIANEILERLDDTFQSDNTDLVGVERRIKEIESLLCTGSAGVYILGIWGIGGIGKTTIADAIFNKISRRFEGSYFVHNVRDAEETDRIKDLQKQLLSKLLNDGNVRNVRFQLKRLARKKKNVFLDIAFFLEGERRDVVISFFDAIGLEAKIELSVLDGKSLITCLDNQIRMHDLLRDMGREIVRKESIDHSGKRSRLWYHKDICEVLKKNKKFPIEFYRHWLPWSFVATIQSILLHYPPQWMWNLRFHTQEAQLILQRTFKVKWWSKFDEQTKLTDTLIRNWLCSKGFLQPTITGSKAQQTFLTQKSKAQSLLASAKTEGEYFKVMEQLFTSRSKSSVTDSSEDEDEDEEPFISLGDENEDDCFGIFSPIKHCK